MAAWLFSARLALLGAVAGLLVLASVVLAASAKPFSAGVAALLALLTLAATQRLARQTDGALALVVSQIAGDLDDRPPMLDPAFAELQKAIGNAMSRLSAERRRLQQSLAEFSALLDNVPAALFVVDRDGRVILTNRAARRLSGGTPRSLAQAGPIAWEDAEDLLRMSPAVGRLLNLTDGRAALAGVATFTPSAGSERHLISLQLVAENLSAVELNAWQAMAKVLAHEMMNSLAPVISLAESLEALAASEDGSERAEISGTAGLIARRAGHILNFVERYREVTDLPEPIFAKVSIREFASDLAGLARALPGAHAVYVEVDPPGLTGHFDRELIEQAMLNLVKNAVEAITAEKCPEIHIICRSDGEMLQLDVLDNGPGLPLDREEIFLPFYTTRKTGSGIGLTIARRLAHAHGGLLLAKPSAKGAHMSLQLPQRPDLFNPSPSAHT